MKVTHLRQVAQHVEDLDRALAFSRDVVGFLRGSEGDLVGLAGRRAPAVPPS